MAQPPCPQCNSTAPLTTDNLCPDCLATPEIRKALTTPDPKVLRQNSEDAQKEAVEFQQWLAAVQTKAFDWRMYWSAKKETPDGLSRFFIATAFRAADRIVDKAEEGLADLRTIK